jgi:hypothetical protein
MNDPESRVAKLKAETRATTALLEDLNTRPRTTYLARVRNPNPELEPAAGPPARHGDALTIGGTRDSKPMQDPTAQVNHAAALKEGDPVIAPGHTFGPSPTRSPTSC